MQRHGIPTARWAVAEGVAEARALINEFGAPVVIKADGLAGGKGVAVCASLDAAERAIDDRLERRIFGSSGDRIVVEEYLEGRELSVFALADGESVLPLIGAQDYKPLLEGNAGPNTGGMGGFAPAGEDPALMQRVRIEILEPTIAAMKAEGCPFVGVLYAGLMLTSAGPNVIEFNCRWGDPEAELIMPLLRSDLVDLMESCLDHAVGSAHLEWEPASSCGVVLAAGGYPDTPSKGDEIKGLDQVDDDVNVFHSGTRLRPGSAQDGGQIVTDGGRVLTVVATAPTLSEARARTYENVQRISFAAMRYRRDIAGEPALAPVGL
jgi:phosphoribosylamine--glycine ligase